MAGRDEPTTLQMWALAIARTVESQGMDAGQVFATAGLTLPENADVDARYPVTDMTRLWRAAALLSGDPAIGLKVADLVQPAYLHALGLVLLTSETFGDVCQRMERYSRLLTDAVVIRMRNSPGRVAIQYHIPPHGVPVAHEDLDAFIGLGVKLGRLLPQRDIHPLAVEFKRPPPSDTRPYREWFRAPIEFGAKKNAVHYSAATLAEPLPTANPVLARVNEQVVVNYLTRLERGPLTARVRSEVLGQLVTGPPRLVEVASLMNMSARALQRRLQAERTSYKAILEEARRELASRYLQQSDLALGNITHMLGFDDQSNFTRAFKRWTGSTPRQYRKQARRRTGLTARGTQLD